VSDSIQSLYRARLAREKGVIRKDWGGRISVALIYPNHYGIGMSNLGFQVLYGLFNGKENVVAERVFLPEGKEMSLHLERGRGLLSLESLSPLERFDLLAFSLSFENDYPNILKILELGRIPLPARDRDLGHPLVMAGGITTFLNPEPLAAFFDLFLLGEAEPVLDPFLESLREARRTCKSREDVLKALAQGVPSAYVPSLYRIEYRPDGTIRSREPTEDFAPEKIPVSRHGVPGGPVSTSTILTPDTAFSDRVLVELGRGCGRSCRFCAAGYVYRPPRVHGESRLLSSIHQVMEECGRIGLLSAAVSDTPGIGRITGAILERGGDFSVSSLRADTLTPELLADLKRSGQKTVAIAPEAGSGRLRKVINKHLSREQIIEAVRLVGRTGEFGLRLYFLIGLPTETHEDVEGILDLVKAIRHHLIRESSTRGRIGQIRLSVNCFVPKAFTPFQWFPMESVPSLKEKQKRLQRAVRREGGVGIGFDVPKWAYVQALLSMGDRRVGSILLLAHEHGGDWRKAFRHSEINPAFFVHRPRGLDEILPWDFIDHRIRKEHLVREYKLALQAKQSETCRVGACDRCGVCEPFIGDGRAD
jgi:radical SAM superfamily enzyme YgiQ (UPF0313 family)